MLEPGAPPSGQPIRAGRTRTHLALLSLVTINISGFLGKLGGKLTALQPPSRPFLLV